MISVVIPAYNEEENIAEAAEAVSSVLSTCGEDFEIIFVDDGSRDLTWEKILSVSERPGSKIRGLRFSRNFGKEAAIRAGLDSSAGDAVAVIDCDLQHPPAKLSEMIEKWRQGADVVEGKKAFRGSEAKSYGFLAKVFNSMMSRATGFDMSGASDFMLLSRRAVEAVRLYGEDGSFFRALAQFVGFKAEAVEYEVSARERGRGKWTFKKLLVYAVKNIASFTDAPLYLSLFAGILSCMSAAVLLVLKILGIPLGSFGGAAITLIFLAGLILISLGVIGFYLSRIYGEVKSRPKYIISCDTREGRQKSV